MCFLLEWRGLDVPFLAHDLVAARRLHSPVPGRLSLVVRTDGRRLEGEDDTLRFGGRGVDGTGALGLYLQNDNAQTLPVGGVDLP